MYSLWQDLSLGTIFFYLVTLTLKNFNLDHYFQTRKVELSYYTCVTRPFTWYHNFCPPLLRKRGDIKSHSSVRLSVSPSLCHKNFNLGHNFCTITGRALILGMCVLCDKTFPMVPCRDLDRDLWPTSRSNLLPSGGPQFSEFACLPWPLSLTYFLKTLTLAAI